MSEVKIIEMDIRGQICPSCLLLTLKEVNSHIGMIKSGEVEVKILSDDRHATITIPEAVNKMGLSTEIAQEQEGFTIRINKPQ